jgi:predicted CoA-binding protein
VKRTLVIGASENPDRYSAKAIKSLVSHNHNVVAIGLRIGEVAGVSFSAEKKKFLNIDTVTLYIGPKNQPEYYDYIVGLKPRRVIFNPGTENDEFIEKLKSFDIYPEVACTLVLLATGQYESNHRN